MGDKVRKINKGNAYRNQQIPDHPVYTPQDSRVTGMSVNVRTNGKTRKKKGEKRVKTISAIVSPPSDFRPSTTNGTQPHRFPPHRIRRNEFPSHGCSTWNGSRSRRDRETGGRDGRIRSRDPVPLSGF